MHELLIRNARVCDGLDGAIRPGGVAVRDVFMLAEGGGTSIAFLESSPAGEPRLTTHAAGVHGVWVNGTRIVGHRGRPGDDARPGRLLGDFA